MRRGRRMWCCRSFRSGSRLFQPLRPGTFELSWFPGRFFQPRGAYIWNAQRALLSMNSTLRGTFDNLLELGIVFQHFSEMLKLSFFQSFAFHCSLFQNVSRHYHRVSMPTSFAEPLSSLLRATSVSCRRRFSSIL